MVSTLIEGLNGFSREERDEVLWTIFFFQNLREMFEISKAKRLLLGLLKFFLAQVYAQKLKSVLVEFFTAC